MKFYNSLTRHKDEFAPLKEGEVRMYTCGPTVYNFAHIGNFRAYVFEDILRRSLKFRGYSVVQVMNLTDVDDKTIRGARAAGLTLQDFTKQYKDAFFEDLKTLGIEAAEVYPAATDHVDLMIDLIQTLFDKGVAYQSDDKSVYFSVSKFHDYGKLAHLDKSGLRAGARVAQDEYEKDSFGDFALWKAWDEDDGDVWWDSPWGRGRPGWHIECSAMAMKYLGQSFDIHTGGIDNLFPHHENEIAQAEAATGAAFCHTWLHCAHLRVNSEKMSKSAGNFYTLRDLVGMGYSPREIRYVLMAGQYRQPLNFAFDALVAARAALARIDEFAGMLREKADAGKGEKSGSLHWADDALATFGAALDDDLNTPEALAALHAMIHTGNKAAAAGELTAADAAYALDTLAAFNTVLNLFKNETAADVPDEVQQLADQRADARKNKNWAESDRLRDAVAALGWTVRDTPQGQKLQKN